MGIFNRRKPDIRPPEVRAAEPDPRKLESGTSFEAKGVITPSPAAFREVGSSAFSQLRDGVPELATRPARLKAWEQMVNDDSSADLASKATKTPVLGADFYIEPGTTDDIDLEAAEFVTYNLFEGLNTPWLGVLEHALTMGDNGFALSEVVYENREWAPKRKAANRRKFTMIRKIAPRPAGNLKSFNYDETGGPSGITYNKVDQKGKVDEVEIPIEKLIVFTWGKKGGDLEGRSNLRSAYKHWYYKNILYKIDGIQKERHGTGVPYVKLPPGFKQKDSDAAWDLVRNVRANEHAGFVEPPNWETGFKKLEGQPVEILPSIEHHDAHILLGVMAQFMLLGTTASGGGSRATSGSLMDMYHKSMRFFAQLVCDHFNLYLIPRLVAYNYNTRNYPMMRVRNIGESKDLQMWASAVANLIARNAITVDIEFEQWTRQILDAPRKRGDRQTPENNPQNAAGADKGDVGEQRGGNKPAPDDATEN
jgi:hypothetical protein